MHHHLADGDGRDVRRGSGASTGRRTGWRVGALSILVLGGCAPPPDSAMAGPTSSDGEASPADGGALPDGSRDGAVPTGGPADAARGGQGGDARAADDALASDGVAATSSLVPTNLRCDLRTDPLQVQSATPRLSWELQSSDAHARGQTQAALEVLVASTEQGLAMDQGDLWSSGTLVSTASKTKYAGQALASLTHAFWKVRVLDGSGNLSAWSAEAEWTQGLQSVADWGAQWISGASSGAVMPIFRHEFDVAKGVERALVSVCGLGQYELRINGSNVSDAVLEPSWTDFAKSCAYRTFDVTSALVQGNNAMAVLLGNGMYNVLSTPGRYTKFTGSFGAPKVIVHLAIAFTDGTSSSVVTDGSWKTAPGPITFTSIYGGEDYDAQEENPGWDAAGFDDAAWSSATVNTGSAPALVAQSVPPIKVMQELPSVSVTEPTPGVFVYDLGQNFSGWPSLEIIGKAGAIVRLTPGELLDSQGTVTQTSMGGGPIFFTYTLRGGSSEAWHPRFSYTGFRYVQVDGAVPASNAAEYPTLPQISSLGGQWVYTSAESVGKFTCSDNDVNRVHELILAAIQSNWQSILTDCPQREKLGWLETGQLLGRSMIFDLDLQSLYEQEVANMADAQTATGLVPSIAPEYAVFSGSFRDSPEWGSAFLIDAWNVYQMFGDSSLLQQNYAAMKHYVSYLSSQTSDGLLAYGLGDWYDVGPAPPGPSQLTSLGVTATGTLYEDGMIMEKTATLLGNSADATQYATLAAASANAFQAKFWNASAAHYDRNSQTDNAVPLALGFAPAGSSAAALTALVQGITAGQYQVTAGDIGWAFVVQALADAGRSDILLSMVKQSANPGYLYMIDHGATSLTEAWNAGPSSSQDHAMLGHIERWFWESLAGFGTEESFPGFERFILAPQMPTGIQSVSATHHAPQGTISSGWVRGTAGVELTVSVPVNTLATVYVPGGAVTESGVPVASARGVTAVTPYDGGVAIDVGSGSYDFVAQ